MINALLSTLLGLNFLAYLMVALRPKLYGAKLYRPMVLNIKLSLAPMAVLMGTLLLVIVLEGVQVWLGDGVWPLTIATIALAAVGLVVWVLLLPNAGYLITELNFNHREHDKVDVPLWYDIVSVLTLAMSGVMNMCFNVFMLQFLLALLLGAASAGATFLFTTISWLVAGALLVLASFGIYLGRYIRFNSWDVKHPLQFLRKLKAHFAAPGSVKNCVLFTLFHSLFFIVFYRATMGVVLGELLANIRLV